MSRGDGTVQCIMGNGHMGIPKQNDRQTSVKTLPSRNFVSWWLKKKTWRLHFVREQIVLYSCDRSDKRELCSKFTPFFDKRYEHRYQRLGRKSLECYGCEGNFNVYRCAGTRGGGGVNAIVSWWSSVVTHIQNWSRIDPFLPAATKLWPR